MVKKNEILLAQFLWELPVVQEEQSRLGELLKNPESLPHKIYQKFALRSKKFQEASKLFQKHIRGFTPGRASYYPEAQKYILKELIENSARTYGWSAYRHAIDTWLSEELPILDATLNEVLIDKKIELTSKNFLLAVLDSAADYDIEPSDLKKLYEVWPLERIDGFDDLLKECKALALPVLNRKGLRQLNKKLSEIESELDEFKSKIKKSELKEKKDKKTIDQKVSCKVLDIEASIEKLQRQISQKSDSQKEYVNTKNQETSESLAQTIQEIKKACENKCNIKSTNCSSSLEKQINDDREEHAKKINELKKRILGVQNALAETLDEVGEHLNTKLSGIEESVDLKIQEIDRKLISHSSSLENDAFLDEHFSLASDVELKHDNNETDFILRFSYYLNRFNIELSRQEELAWHIYLKENPILIINDRRILDAWFNALGWTRLPIKFAASPRWSSPNHWHKNALSLLQMDRTLPIIIEIFNFDVGLIEGYLLPTLTLWKESGFKGGIGNKIILHPSNHMTKSDLLLVSEYGNCLGASSNKTDISHYLNYSVSKFSLNDRRDHPPITTVTLNDWEPPLKKNNDSLFEKFIEDCISFFDETDIKPPVQIYNRLPTIFAKYGEKFLLNESLYSSFKNIFITPWLDGLEALDDSHLSWDSDEQ